MENRYGNTGRNSLILLSEVFHTSIDNLIKGDVEVMKEQVKNEDRKGFEKISRISRPIARSLHLWKGKSLMRLQRQEKKGRPRIRRSCFQLELQL